MTRRPRSCRCCRGPSAGPYCQPCVQHAATYARVTADIIAALWGHDGVHRYETELRARRLAAKRTTTRRTA